MVDLARILSSIDHVNVPETHRAFFRLIFASIIRRASNADPVPVSGLEVTAHMKRLDSAGRLINPFQLFFKAMRKRASLLSEITGKHLPPSHGSPCSKRMQPH